MIVAAGRATHAAKAVGSALIEIDTKLKDLGVIIDTMLEPGFAFSRAQLARSRRV